MPSQTQDVRLDVRLKQVHKNLIEQAARISGQSVSAFTVSILVQQATEVIRQAETLHLSDRDRDIFMNALDNPPAPNKHLRKAARDHAEQVKS